MDSEDADGFLQSHRPRASTSTSPPSARSTPALTRHTLSVSSLATSSTLPDYPSTLSPSRHSKRPSRSLGSWASLPADVDVLPDYKSPPATIPGFNAPDYISDGTIDSFTAPYDSVYGHRLPLERHRSQLSTSSTKSHDEEMESRLDDLVARSVHALEVSNRLLSRSVDEGHEYGVSERSRSAESMRGRRRDRTALFSGRNRWADEPVLEEDEGEDSSWEESAYVGSLPETSYMSPSPALRDSRHQTFARTSSYNSINGRPSAVPSLDSYRFPSPRHQQQSFISDRYPGRSSPSRATSSRTPSRSSSIRTSRPAPLQLAAADSIASPQVSTSSSQHSTPAYQLVSSILSREATQQRRNQAVSSSQPSTPTPPSFMSFARPKSSMSLRNSVDAGRPSSKTRKLGRLPASISVPDDIGKWMRSLEPVNPSDTLTEEPPTEQDILIPQPRRTRVISPSLPDSPPRTPMAVLSPPPSSACDTQPLARSISQLRTILSSQPSPPLPPPRKRPQFQPMTPQLPSTHLTAPPPTRSQSVPPPSPPPPQEHSLPASIRRLKGKGKGNSKHVSFSPTPTEIPSRATSPPPEDPLSSKARPTTGWSIVEWLLPRTSPGGHGALKPKKAKKDTETSVARLRTWTVDGRPDWNDRTAESWMT